MPSWAAFLVVFAASACTLILEVVAGRVLAPYLGVSLYTWTSIIGVILAGISMGNYVGGRVADRWPRRSTLGVLLAVSGILSLAVLPLIGLATSIDTRSLVGVTNPLGGELPAYVAAVLVARIVLITMIVFLPPAFVLGMVSPVVMKVRISDLERAGRLEHTGRMLGKLDAVSTLGGIVGTFATGFVLVQAFGTRTIVLGVGLVLIALGVLFGDLLKARRAAAPLAALFVLGVLLIPARQAFAYGCIPNQLTPECLGRAANDGVRQSMAQPERVGRSREGSGRL